MKDYKLYIVSKTELVYVKKYNDCINQVVVKKPKSKKPMVELTINGMFIDQTTIKELQIALNKTKKDVREWVDEVE